MQSIEKLMSPSTSSSIEVIGHNEDLMTQIAVYIPVKSILRFRYVSKQWNSLLTHPNFFLSYKSKKSLLFLQLEPDNKPEYFYPKDNPNLDIAGFNCLQIPSQESFVLENSCNGLLLVQSVIYKNKSLLFKYTFYVCNPSTKKHFRLFLPDVIATTDMKGDLSSCLAFDPLVSPYYKVVFLRWHQFTHCHHIYIYSSETKTCRQIEQTIDGYFYAWYSFFFNGLICWADIYAAHLYYFDVKQESFNVFPKPPVVGKIRPIKYFGELRGHLNIILFDLSQHLRNIVDVYELKEDYSSWVTKYKVDMESISIGFPEIYNAYGFSVMCSLEGEEAPTLVVYVESKLLLAYNLMDNTTRKLVNLPHFGSHKIIKALQCTESLFGV